MLGFFAGACAKTAAATRTPITDANNRARFMRNLLLQDGPLRCSSTNHRIRGHRMSDSSLSSGSRDRLQGRQLTLVSRKCARGQGREDVRAKQGAKTLPDVRPLRRAREQFGKMTDTQVDVNRGDDDRRVR